MDEMRFNILERPLPSPIYWPAAALLLAALAARPIRRRVERTLSDLDMHHRTSALSHNAAAGPGPRAGDRLPDTPVTHDGERTTLHALLSYDRWTLLTPPSTDLAALRRLTGSYRAPIAVAPICTDYASTTTTLGLADTMLLVRPDRHIGLRTTGHDLTTLNDYCAKHLRRT